jgi:hypothetical protein
MCAARTELGFSESRGPLNDLAQLTSTARREGLG